MLKPSLEEFGSCGGTQASSHQPLWFWLLAQAPSLTSLRPEGIAANG